MSRSTSAAGLSFLLAVAIVATVSASARFMYSDGKAVAADVVQTNMQDEIACR